MPHVLIVDVDDLTLTALKEFIDRPQIGRTTSSINQSREERKMENADDLKVITITRRAGFPGAAPVSQEPYSARKHPLLRAGGGLLPTHPRFMLLFAGWRLDVAARELWTVDNGPVSISDGEFELLFAFAKHPLRALTRQRIIALMCGEARLTRPRSVDVCVSRLRQKLEKEARCPRIIQTVRNGYKFNVPVTVTCSG